MHMLDPWQLKAFLAAASAGSLRRAAEELSLSPSAVTARIKALEQTVGVALFVRTGNRASLTEHGRRLAGYARRLLDLEAEARQRLSGDGHDGLELSVRLSESLGLALLPRVLPAFRARHPRLRLIVSTRSEGGLARALRQGVADCGLILGQPYAAEGIAATVLHREPLVVIAPPGGRPAGPSPAGLDIGRGAGLEIRPGDWPGDGLDIGLDDGPESGPGGRGSLGPNDRPGHGPSRRSSLGPDDFHGRHLFITRHVWGQRERLEQALARAGAVPASVTECGSLAIIAGCVARGLGLALAPQLAVPVLAARGGLAVADWAGGGLEAAVTLMRLAGREAGPAEAAFLDCLGAALAEASQEAALCA